MECFEIFHEFIPSVSGAAWKEASRSRFQNWNKNKKCQGTFGATGVWNTIHFLQIHRCPLELAEVDSIGITFYFHPISHARSCPWYRHSPPETAVHCIKKFQQSSLFLFLQQSTWLAGPSSPEDESEEDRGEKVFGKRHTFGFPSSFSADLQTVESK